MAVGAQQVGQQVGVRGIALGAVAAVARAAGLDRIGVNREDLMAGLDQRVHDQARRTFDGDAHPRPEAGQAAQQLGQAVAVMLDLEALQHTPGGVDDTHRMDAGGPVQPTEDIGIHGQAPWSCGMTARIGRRGGKLIDRRSSVLGLALHPVARCGLPAPCSAAGLMRAIAGKQRWQSPQGHGSRFTPSAVLLIGVNADQRHPPRLLEHGLPTGCFAVVDNAPRGPMRGRCVVHNQAPWTTLRRATSNGCQWQEDAQ